MPIIEKKPLREPLGGSFSWSASPPNHRKVLRWSPPRRQSAKPPVNAGLRSVFASHYCRVAGSPLQGCRAAWYSRPPRARLKRLRHLQAFRPAPLPFASGLWCFSCSPLRSFLPLRLRCFAPAPLGFVFGLQCSRLRRLRHFKPSHRAHPHSAAPINGV